MSAKSCRRPCFSIQHLAMLTVLVSLGVGLVIGCGDETLSQTGPWTQIPVDSLTGAQTDQHQRLMAARDDLIGTLKSRLMDVIVSEGPAGAVGICSSEAHALGDTIAQKHHVKIGRTSHKLRNPKNRPPKWAESYVANRVEDPQILTGPNGQLAALFPIRTGVPCLTCHGPLKSLDEDVRSILAERYPDDAALGFAEDDLRGWVWVNTMAADRP